MSRYQTEEFRAMAADFLAANPGMNSVIVGTIRLDRAGHERRLNEAAPAQPEKLEAGQNEEMEAGK